MTFSTSAFAADSVGRLTLGLSTSTERFSTDDFGSSTNDTLYSSQRFYLKTTRIGEDDWHITFDIRNKYDNFDKLNRTEYKLNPKDEFQIRELSIKPTNPSVFWIPQFGRFSLLESGGLFVDGLDNSFRTSQDSTFGFFAGLNPKKEGRATLEFDSNSQIYGLHVTYQDPSKDFNKNFYLTHGLTQQTFYGAVERQFLYHNLHYQWGENSTVSTLAYFDFKPSSRFQAAQIFYQDQFGKYFRPGLEHLEIDVIEYQRRQNTLEKLTPSPYKESTARLEYLISPVWTAGLSATSGRRQNDGFSKSEFNFRNSFQNFINRNWDSYIGVLSRKNFTSQDSGFSAGLGYYSDRFESTLDFEQLTQKNDDDTTTHPTILELTGSMQFSKQYFVTSSLQTAKDETVTINSLFLKFIYRFGTKDIPPLRDGAAPRGAL